MNGCAIGSSASTTGGGYGCVGIGTVTSRGAPSSSANGSAIRSRCAAIGSGGNGASMPPIMSRNSVSLCGRCSDSTASVASIACRNPGVQRSAPSAASGSRRSSGMRSGAGSALGR